MSALSKELPQKFRSTIRFKPFYSYLFKDKHKLWGAKLPKLELFSATQLFYSSYSCHTVPNGWSNWFVNIYSLAPKITPPYFHTGIWMHGSMYTKKKLFLEAKLLLKLSICPYVRSSVWIIFEKTWFSRLQLNLNVSKHWLKIIEHVYILWLFGQCVCL